MAYTRVFNDLQARLCPNSIVNSDFALPLKISKFCKEIHAGFGLLNLKNDSLRKRFDGMKYDIKKMEEGQSAWRLSPRAGNQCRDAGAFRTGLTDTTSCFGFAAVVYDISLRGLVPSAAGDAASNKRARGDDLA